MSQPIHTVGVMCIRGEDVLLIQRGKAPRKGEWSIPGGRIEPGETEAEAALRELHEETGVQARLIGKITRIDAVFEGTPYVLHDYAAIWESGEPRAGDDAADARFVPVAQIGEYKMWAKTEKVILDAYAKVSSLSAQAE